MPAATRASASTATVAPARVVPSVVRTSTALSSVTANSGGYWLVAADGGVFAFGDAAFHGSTGALHLNEPIVGIAATPDGGGYWLVASDGGVFAFGDAAFYGSTGNIHLNEPIVGIAATSDGGGYWMAASDGGVFAFGDATFYGSTGAEHLNRPIVGIAATPNGGGYWLVASDGGVFTFGDAGYFGSAPPSGPGVGDIVALAPALNGEGYWITRGNGSIDQFGDAPFEGSAMGQSLNQPVVGFAAEPRTTPGLEALAPLSITTTTLPSAAVGVPYQATLSASGGATPYGWRISAGSLPAGVTLSSNGSISGIPSAQGSSSFTVQVTDSTVPTALTATAMFSLMVQEAPLSIATRNLPNATVGTVYGATLDAAGGTSPYTWTLTSGSLPAGMSLSASGVISGAPTGQGSSSFKVQALDATAPTPLAAAATLSIAVFPPAGTPTTIQSSNWSGYVEINGPFTEVTGTFSAPSLTAGTPSGDLMSVWAGVGGGNGGGDNSLIQAGFNESPDPGSASGFIIQPWWEILPNAETFISGVQIEPGDDVTVSIGQISGTDWGITLTDDTNGESFTTDQTYSGSASTAEWIVEALTENQMVTTLAPYSPYVNFSDLGFLGANTNLQQVVMVQSGNQVSTPSALTPNGFNVAYGATAPPTP